ncbi:hypothetical protein TBR22_A42570 [Luteitalea sp. TBR-22]|uniref:hypothetical protein n=1 Tax=Luteitalea sp. TBR-22 TaxID=2802971 RepID=UPI001AF902DA|nr:hypothetical protein [Luteitalea sp. TBR-22]BCS35031.1 hypothetical protein TBR22_A42570 [Luteitalea sp. TBR-22]
MWKYASVTALVLSVVVLGNATSPSIGQDPEYITIDGKKNPEKIPVHIAWEHFFRNVVLVAYPEGAHEADPVKVKALADLNLHVTEDDMRQILTIGQRAIAESDAMRAPLNDEHEGKRQLDWSLSKRLAQVKASQDVFLRARSDCADRLSPSAFQAVSTYVQKHVVPGVSYHHRPNQ